MTLSRELTTTEGTVEEITNPDLTGFNPYTTYFVTYDENNQNPTLGDKISTKTDTLDSSKLVAANAPENWYDYTKKRWANVATRTEDGKMSYWTWVPRYEYKVDESSDSTDIIFIPSSKTSADSGYTIPEAFTWDGKALDGYWVAKYEVAELN